MMLETKIDIFSFTMAWIALVGGIFLLTDIIDKEYDWLGMITMWMGILSIILMLNSNSISKHFTKKEIKNE